MLAQTLGVGKAQVLVYANMNVNQTTQESLTYAKAGTRSRRANSSRRSTGTGTGAGGATGTANLTAAAGAAGGKSNYKRETTNSQLAVGKTVTHSTIAPGTVESQHVSVLLDHSVPPPRCPRSAKRSPTPPASRPSAATRSRSDRSRSRSPPRPRPLPPAR
jgi:flagellar M-ring protein FliF